MSETELKVALRNESGVVVRVYSVMPYGTGWAVSGYVGCLTGPSD